MFSLKNVINAKRFFENRQEFKTKKSWGLDVPTDGSDYTMCSLPVRKKGSKFQVWTGKRWHKVDYQPVDIII